MITNLTVETFDGFIGSADKPVLVDYWADWCRPCKMMLPVLEQLSDEWSDRLLVAKVDVEAEGVLANGLNSIPTLRLYKSGEIVYEATGAKPKLLLMEELESHLQ
jgi:thioredoxin 1